MKKHSCLRNKPNQGFTLIEMVVAISLLSVILSMVITTMVSVINKNQAVSFHMIHQNSLNRFNNQFREDIHQAKSVAINDKEGQQELVISKGDQRETVYSPDNHMLSRIERNKTETVSSDTFHFKPETKISFNQNDDPRFMDAVFSFPIMLPDDEYIPENFSPEQSMTITALIGKDSRYEKLALTAEKKPEENKETN